MALYIRYWILYRECSLFDRNRRMAKEPDNGKALNLGNSIITVGIKDVD